MTSLVSHADPLFSFYDDATGAHSALTAASLGSWASRTSALLTSGCGLGPGTRVAVLLPPHWQTAVALLGAWSAGVAVSYRLSTSVAGLPVDDDGPFDALFVSRGRLDDWLVDVPSATHRFLFDVGDEKRPVATPDGYREFLPSLGSHASDPDPSVFLRATDPATADGTTFGQWGSLAHELGQRADLARGDRVLVDAAEHEHPLKWLLTPLSAGASVVLCANLDRSRLDTRIAAERVTHVL
ncbi:TIGR03089 family protein [Asanoa hainanensis]|uniref:TIGR03089 family protein n=1 Tax=Asanoa hainanensis TaxID=560556 RepID=A0A239NW87_9ACTN|nr:TIGR03089 family protein [Asanoa hainanensis]SNT59106.1 TIGR03089 family protein [Asanoa hainanensis]